MGRLFNNTSAVITKSEARLQPMVIKALELHVAVARDVHLEARREVGLFDGHKVYRNRRNDHRTARRNWKQRERHEAF